MQMFSPMSTIFLRVLIVLALSYLAAWLSAEMVYVILTLAAAGIVAASIPAPEVSRRTEDDTPETLDQIDQTDLSAVWPNGI